MPTGWRFTVALLSIVIVPALVQFLGVSWGDRSGVPPGAVAVTLLSTVLLPLAAGVVVQRVLPRVAERIREPLVQASNIVLWVAIVLLLIGVLPGMLPAVFEVTNLATLLAIACANRNPGIAIAVANFPAENFGATIALYAILVGIVSKPYINWQKRRLAATQQIEQGG